MEEQLNQLVAEFGYRKVLYGLADKLEQDAKVCYKRGPVGIRIAANLDLLAEHIREDIEICLDR